MEVKSSHVTEVKSSQLFFNRFEATNTNNRNNTNNHKNYKHIIVEKRNKDMHICPIQCTLSVIVGKLITIKMRQYRMVQCKTAVSPLLMQCRYYSLALSHPYIHCDLPGDEPPLKQTMARYRKSTSHIYRQLSNISRTLVGNKIVDHSDVVGASTAGAAPTTSSFST